MGKVNWFWLTETVEKLKSSTLQPEEAVDVIPASTNLPTVAGTFADLVAARTAVEAQRAGAEPRLDALETKVNEIITKLKTAGIIL